ncbi:MAG: 30S ribosomal protein S7 [bacterium]
MPRKGFVREREIAPDPIYNSKTVSKFINTIMRRGKKGLAERIFYGALGIIEEKTGEYPVAVVERAIDNVKPVLEVKSRRVGGATYQVPVEVPAKRRLSLALRWIAEAARNRRERTMKVKLASEILDAARGEGAAVRKREEIHRMAEANRAFAHYRW